MDGPPGIGCPVIAACSGTQTALLVTEPTASGVHDLQSILATTERLRVPALVLVNKADLSPAKTQEIEAMCATRGVEVIDHIPFDEQVTQSMVCGQPATAQADSSASVGLRRAWERARALCLG